MIGSILVTGGTGNLGRRLLPLLREAGPEVRHLSRRPQPADPLHLVGDTVSDIGLDAAMCGAGVVIHLAGGARGDGRSALHVARAARRAAVNHLLFISVIGADRMPIGYFRAKAAAEHAVERSGVPFTILRAAQFHDFLHPVMRVVASTPVVPSPLGLRFEPIDADAVATRLAELALGSAAGRVADLAGPEVRDLASLAQAWRLSRGARRRAVVGMPMPGAVGRAYRAGQNLAGTDVERRGRTWEESLKR